MRRQGVRNGPYADVDGPYADVDGPYAVVDARTRRSLGLIVYVLPTVVTGPYAVEALRGRARRHRIPVVAIAWDGRHGYTVWPLDGRSPKHPDREPAPIRGQRRDPIEVAVTFTDEPGATVADDADLPDVLRGFARGAHRGRRVGAAPPERGILERFAAWPHHRLRALDALLDAGPTDGPDDAPAIRPLGAPPQRRPPSGIPARPPRKPVVETGFAPPDAPSVSIDAHRPLPAGRELLFWFAIGSGRARAIDVDPAAVPGSAPGRALTVQLFGFDGELQPVGPAQGRIVLDAAECSRVDVPAALPPGTLDADQVLYFPVRTPSYSGTARLRCHVYSGATLVQSHLVTAQVAVRPAHHREAEVPTDGPALRTDVDYRLADELRAADLDRLPGHDLSLLVNGNATTHQLRVLADADGEQPFVHDSSLAAHGLETAIDTTRDGLRRAAWGTAEEWTDDPAVKPARQAYRYADTALDDPTPRPLPAAKIDRLATDLIRLARDGSRLYLPLGHDLAGGADARDRLERFLASTRRIQIASAASGLYVPAAIFYDHRLEDGVETGYQLCADFRGALERGEPLERLRCLRDGCRERDDLLSVCVSGFWGFRHEIGWPLSTARPLTTLTAPDGPELLIGVSTDPGLERRDAHVARIGGLASSAVARDRDAFAAELRARTPTVIYLYCHGGLTPSKVPYVEIGARGGPVITEAFWRNHGIRFDDPDHRPLVFVNGCHTTALDPSQVVNLVDGFVREANAVGAIGTELTVFEPLAVAFGEAVMTAFIDGSATIGSAVRRARLRLLQQGNPLGLVYVPFVAADTRVVAATTRDAAAEDDVPTTV